MRYRIASGIKLPLLRRGWLSRFGTTRAITRAELDQLRLALPWRDSLACAIMADTGLRVSDVLNIQRDKLADTMTVKEIKTGKTRTVHLTPDTLKEAQTYIKTHSSPYVINCHRSTLWRSIVHAADAFGWQHISPHSFRKLFAVEYCARHGLKATQQELQHKHLSTTLAYVTDTDAISALIPGGKI